jgi:phosphoglycerate dehydrogenase-like enzyme
MAEVAAEKEIFLALDVFETEPLAEDSPLRKNERVLLTPHRANNSIEFEERWKCLGSDIELFVNGKQPESALTVARAKVMSES